MRKHDFLLATRIFLRSRSTQAVLDNKSLKDANDSSGTSEKTLTALVSGLRTAPYTTIPRTLVPAVVGVLVGSEAGGVPPFASVYTPSRHDCIKRIRSAHKGQENRETSPPSPQDLWTRALTLASNDVKNITSKMLVYFFERKKASYRPWTPNVLSPDLSSITAPGPLDIHQPILVHPIRLTLSHYTTLIHGLLLRRHYPIALTWVRKLIYPIPSFPTYTSSHLKLLSRTLSHSRRSRDSVYLDLDGPALSACLVVLARLGRVHEATTVLEAYAAPRFLDSPSALTPSARHRHVRLNTIQMNDFLLTLLRWPSKIHALPVPSVDFPISLRSIQASLSSVALDKPMKKTTGNISIGLSSWLKKTKGPTRSARPDLLLRLLPALYPRYGVPWDTRTVCLLLQAVRMCSKMDDVSAFGLRKAIQNFFGGSTKITGKETVELNEKNTNGSDPVDRQSWLVENIMEVLWEPVDTGNSRSPSSPSKPSIKKTGKQKQKGKSSHTRPPIQSPFLPLEYSPFTPWPTPFSSSGSSLCSSSVASVPRSTTPDSDTSTAVNAYSPSIAPTHPFLLAREIFLRLIWEHAATLNSSEGLDINLHTIPSPAILPPSSLAQLLDPDGDGLGHLGGLPKWLSVLEVALKRKIGLGTELLNIPTAILSLSSSTNSPETITTSTRIKLVDDVFGYPKDSSSPALPKLTPIAFHHYILLLGLSAPEPWKFVQAGWNQRYPFESYPQSIALTYPNTNIVPQSTTPLTSSLPGPFTGCTSSISQKTRGSAPADSLHIIPGLSEIPISLSYMRALRLVPTKDTLCAAIVFWREAVGGETLAELGVREYKKSRTKMKDGSHSSLMEEEEAYTREYDIWKDSVESLERQNRNGKSREENGQGGSRETSSEPGRIGEYAKFCRWIRDWVDEINIGSGTRMVMPHPYHIHRWAGIVRKMREGQGYERGKGSEDKEERTDSEEDFDDTC